MSFYRDVEYSSKILLRRSNLSDLEFILTLESKEENKPYITIWERRQHEHAIHDENIAHMIIEDKQLSKPVGFVIISDLHNNNNNVEFTRIVIDEKGKGYGKQALQWIKKWVFEDLKAHRLWLDVKVTNRRAKGTYEAEGFTLEGTLRECVKNGESYESLHIMSILKSEYES
ncbi:GNAT family N-acetyltransferase [Paenibacillus lentus]|uniref:GNAT family N-acetyltransferase n=1 Tax=Paenibacillus lentus TaxID=1338368 RepID=UPI00364D0C85